MKPDHTEKDAKPVLGWGSDIVAELLRRLGIKYVCVNPGSSFRGLHDSLINYLGNDDPTTRRMLEGILAMEEEHADDLASLLEQLGA